MDPLHTQRAQPLRRKVDLRSVQHQHATVNLPEHPPETGTFGLWVVGTYVSGVRTYEREEGCDRS